MRWLQIDKVERVAFVIYLVGALVFIIFATFALIAGERSTWTVYAMLLWQIAFTAFNPLYRRWRAKNRANESVDDEAGANRSNDETPPASPRDEGRRGRW